MKYFYVTIVLLVLSGCGQGPLILQGDSDPSVSPSPSPSASSSVESIVDAYNLNQAAVDQSQGIEVTQIAPGLRCTLYSVPNMPATPCLLSTSIAGCSVISSSAGYTTVGSFLYLGAIDQGSEPGTDGFNLLPEAFQSYSTNFAVTCTGYFVNDDYNWHQFSTASDDGSLLYLNGGLVVNNDGEHSIATVASAPRLMTAAVYSIQVNYFQGPGNIALMVNMDGNPIPAANLYH